MKKIAKIVFVSVVLMLVMSMCCFGASALKATGQCGDNVYWSFDESTGELVISGSGKMYDYQLDEWNASETPFEDSNIKSVVIEDGVTAIGNYAFDYCHSLTSITIPDSVTTIGNRAFFYCDGLTSVTIPDSVTTIGDYAFSSCNSLASVTIPDSVVTIGDSAFSACDGFTSVTIPDSVTIIGAYAFRFCDNLTSVTIPDSVITIGISAFAACDRLTSITVDDDNANYCSADGVLFDKNKKTLIQYPGGKERTAYAIPYGVTAIGEDAFYRCKKLTSVTIPGSVTAIGDFAFEGCTGLASVTVPDSVTAIGKYAFEGCIGLTSVTLGNNVTTIGRNAFYSCTGLTSVTIPDSVTTIGDSAFRFCKNLTSVVIGKGVTAIGEDAFYFCERLASVTIPDSVTAIGDGTFSYCTGLTSVTIPDSVTTIGKGAFSCCTGLTSVTVPDSVTAIGKGAFDYCDSLTDVYYKGTKTQWNKISVGSGNSDLTSATIHYGAKEQLGKPAKITATQSTASVKLTWTAVEGANAYGVYRKTSSGWKKLGQVAKLNGTINNLAAGTKYTFAVQAGKTKNGTTVWADTYTTISTATKTVKPASVKATQNTAEIKLSWNKVAGATGYRIFYKSGGKWKVTVDSTTAISHTFKNLKAGAKYTFAVQPYIKTSSGVVWGEYATYTASTLPAMVTVKATSSSTGEISLSWNAVNGSEGYQIWYKKGDGSYKLYKVVSSSTKSYFFSNLTSGTKYTFAVRAGIKTSSGNIFGAYKTSTVTVK